MSGVDWGAAPEDATHCMEGNHPHIWRKQADGYWSAWVEGEWVAVLMARADLYTARPAKWSGDGMPPVGSVCEFRISAGDDWGLVEVKYLSAMTALLLHLGESGDAEGAYDPKSCMFRPVRASEIIAAEKQAEAIEDMIRHVKAVLGAEVDANWSFSRDVMRILYIGGFRKESQP